MNLKCASLGVVPYGQALALQLRLREELIATPEDPGWLLFLEHPGTVTLGKRGKMEDLVAREYMRNQGIEVFKVDRGGEATYHGPGQLIVYPIVRLEVLKLGVVDLIRGLAQCLADVCAEYGAKVAYDKEHPGLWTDETPPRKMASVGMRVSGGITTHGAAINLVNDLTPFSWIVACGMPGAPVVKLSDFSNLKLEDFRGKVQTRLGEFLGFQLIETPLELPEASDWVKGLDF